MSPRSKAPVTLLAVAIIIVSAPFSSLAEDCPRAVDLYNRGTLSDNAAEKEMLFREAMTLCAEPEVLSKILNNMADLHEKEKEYSKALSGYRQSIKTKNNFATPYLGAADVFCILGDYYSAFVMYDKGLKYQPDDREGIQGRERARTACGRRMLVYFKIDSAEIPDEYVYRLDLIGDHMRNTEPALQIRVVGHTCDLGSSEHNRRLSGKRAATVANYLESRGYSKGHAVEVFGKGPSEPLLPNVDKESRTLNRRVEVILE